MKILAIESSCDETAAAVIENGTNILSSVIATSSEFHKDFGGILPELAARKQLEFINPVIAETIRKAFPTYFLNETISNKILECIAHEIDAIAVTQGPGLIGSLLIGVEAAKTIAFVTGKPIIPVNHVYAHIFANIVNYPAIMMNISDTFPAIALVVSGGHTELFLMTDEKTFRWLGGTIDDAAGEAFDKSARLLGFNNLGGKAIEQSAKKYNHQTMRQYKPTFPRPMMHDLTLNFSFSGLKTSILREWKKHEQSTNQSSETLTSSFAFEIQEAITDVLVSKTVNAANKYNARSIWLAGGVAANTRLREKFAGNINNQLFKFYAPPIELCTDNAVVIGSYGYYCGKPVQWDTINAIPNLDVEH